LGCGLWPLRKEKGPALGGVFSPRQSFFHNTRRAGIAPAPAPAWLRGRANMRLAVHRAERRGLRRSAAQFRIAPTSRRRSRRRARPVRRSPAAICRSGARAHSLSWHLTAPAEPVLRGADAAGGGRGGWSERGVVRRWDGPHWATAMALQVPPAPAKWSARHSERRPGWAALPATPWPSRRCRLGPPPLGPSSAPSSAPRPELVRPVASVLMWRRATVQPCPRVAPIRPAAVPDSYSSAAESSVPLDSAT